MTEKEVLLLKQKQVFADMLVFKEPQQSLFFKMALGLPSFMRDWLVMRFANQDGSINKEKVEEYVSEYIPRPKREEWNEIKHRMVNKGETVKILAKVKVDIDIASEETLFALPDFGFPSKRHEAVIDRHVLLKNENELVKVDEVWGIIELACYREKGNISRVHMIDFKPFCPYRVDLEYYRNARQNFTIDEWLDVLLLAIDYNPDGYLDKVQKLTMLSRLLPFVEKRVNLIELAPKGTGKSYVYAQISKYGWMVSGGSISRAKLFYDVSKKAQGIIGAYDYIALDEMQSIKFSDPEQIRGIWKDYLESGEYRVGTAHCVGESGFVLLGNIDESLMRVEVDMFQQLPTIFHESALLDRFHGIIKGWDIPRMKESLKAHGWALNVEYFSEIMHLLRDDVAYRLVVDQALNVPKGADTRDTEAIKRLCTGFLKLFFPHIRDAEDLDVGEFTEYCLNPAIAMRVSIKKQLGIIDREFRGKQVPDITCKLFKKE